MEQIAEGIFIETQYKGVTLGAVDTGREVLYIDAPLLRKDAHRWRNHFERKQPSKITLTALLDAHFDRTIGSRFMESPLITQEETMNVFQNRPVSFQADTAKCCADWESLLDMDGFRWIQPEISFEKTMTLNLSSDSVSLLRIPGPAIGSCAVIIPKKKIVFIGDAVLVDQIPFLQDADVFQWLHTLDIILQWINAGYQTIGGREAKISAIDVAQMRFFLDRIAEFIRRIQSGEIAMDEVCSMINKIDINELFHIKNQDMNNALTRLRNGLKQYCCHRKNSLFESH